MKGRATPKNIKSRFDRYEISPFDDGLSASAPKTILKEEHPRTIITRNSSPDVPFDQSINPYQGCEHGCVYCFARPSHAYWDLSPGLDFETRIFHKPKAPELLRKELSKPGYRCQVLALGANTDPYQPAEKKLRITRRILEVLREFRHPVSIVTKSNMVLRDADILSGMAVDNLSSVYVSVTTLDHELARKMEPRAPTPERRLYAIAELSKAGIPVGVLASPMIPSLNDHDLEAILERAAQAGATTANYILVRLPHEVKDLFIDWLDSHYPLRKNKILNKLREMRNNALNDPRFHTRMKGQGPYAALLKSRFERACSRLGLVPRAGKPLDTTRFRVPARGQQARLFDLV